MNYLIWNRASKAEYNAWEDILGNEGWNWSTISDACEASEHFFAPISNVVDATYNIRYHGQAGPVYSTMQKNTFTLYSDYLKPTLRSLKVRLPVDRDSGNTIGAGPVPVSINRDSYTRSYSASAYTTAQARPNLHVHTDALVTKLVWDTPSEDGSQVASGVHYRNKSRGANGATSFLQAREIILSAGSIQTPQILELSGIGNPKILTALNIPIKIDLPAVGTNLQDKLTYAGGFSFNTSGFNGAGYVQTFLDYATPSRLLVPADLDSFNDLVNSAETSSTMSQAAISMLKHIIVTDQPVIEFGWFLSFVNIYLLHPLSTGTVHIKTVDPTTPPIINPQYNSAMINGTSIDLWLLSKAVAYLTKTLATTAPFSDIEAMFSVDRTLSDHAIQHQVYQKLGVGQHWTGGAVMLPREDGGVVDHNLLVYGTQNVRVVDSSVIPTVPGQHPMGLAYAIAMRAAEIMLGS